LSTAVTKLAINYLWGQKLNHNVQRDANAS